MVWKKRDSIPQKQEKSTAQNTKKNPQISAVENRVIVLVKALDPTDQLLQHRHIIIDIILIVYSDRDTQTLQVPMRRVRSRSFYSFKYFTDRFTHRPSNSMYMHTWMWKKQYIIIILTMKISIACYPEHKARSQTEQKIKMDRLTIQPFVYSRSKSRNKWPTVVAGFMLIACLVAEIMQG